jgi:hypothetical protein
MKKNRIEFAYAHFVLKWKHFMAFPKKENGLPVQKSIFFSANPACSLRFPIAATQAKLILI